MTRRDRDRVDDIRAAIEAIGAHVGAASDFEDPLVHDAVLYQFVVIGEAVKNLAAQTRERAPDVPWRDVAGLRDLIAHECFRIEGKRIAEVVERDLPALRAAIDSLLSDWDETDAG